MIKFNRQKIYVLISIILLLSTGVAAAYAGTKVFRAVGDAEITGDLTVSGTVSGSNLTSNDMTGIGPYSYLIGSFSNGSYYAVNGSDNEYIVSWTSTNCSYPIEQANLQGGNIYFASGTYPIAYNLTITRHKTAWTGSGATSILQLANNYTSIITVLADDVTFTKLYFDGNKASSLVASQDTGHSTGCGIIYKQGVNMKVSLCDFKNFGLGHPVVNFPSWANSSYGSVVQCYFTNNSWWDVAWAGGDYNTVENCILVDTTGIELGSVAGSTDYNIASNNQLIRCGGFYLGGANNTVFCNILKNPTGLAGGIQAYPMNIAGANNTVTYNRIEGFTLNWGYALNCNGAGAFGNKIADNTIASTKGTSAKSIGIVSASNNIIANNKVIDGVIGIYVHDAPATSNRIYNNDIAATTPFSDAGTTTLAWDNIFNGTFTVGIG